MENKQLLNQSSRIGITGATGMVGSYLLKTLLSKGYTNITCLKRPSSSLELTGNPGSQVQWQDGDLLDTESLWEFADGLDVVFHCGAMVSFNPKRKKDLHRINVTGTADLVDACLAQGVGFFVHCSSVSALGKAGKDGITDEEAEWDPKAHNSPYAKTKYYSEMEVFRAMAEGLEGAIINPSIILGGGFWKKGSARLHLTVSRGLPFYPMGSGGFVDARDVAEMMIDLCNPAYSGRRFICNAENRSYRDILSRIATGLDVKAPGKPLKKWMISTAPLLFKAGRFLGLNTPKVTADMLKASHRNARYNNERSIEELGFKYRPIDQTLDSLSEAYLQSQKMGKDYGLLPVDA